MSNEIIFYDLPSRGRCACWSLNPWKARLALNFKGLPYRTEWIEYPNIRSKFQSWNIPPNTRELNPNAEYSIPTARLPDGRYVMDSLAIAHELEKLQPTPSLHLDHEVCARTQAAVAKLAGGLAPIAIPRVPANVLTEESQPYFLSTRISRFGMPLPDLAKSARAGEAAWSAAAPGFADVAAILAEDPSGPYVLGQTPSFADFILAGLWQFYLRLDEGGDLFDRTLRYDARFREHYQACREWLARDD